MTRRDFVTVFKESIIIRRKYLPLAIPTSWEIAYQISHKDKMAKFLDKLEKSQSQVFVTMWANN